MAEANVTEAPQQQERAIESIEALEAFVSAAILRNGRPDAMLFYLNDRLEVRAEAVAPSIPHSPPAGWFETASDEDMEPHLMNLRHWYRRMVGLMVSADDEGFVIYAPRNFRGELREGDPEALAYFEQTAIELDDFTNEMGINVGEIAPWYATDDEGGGGIRVQALGGFAGGWRNALMRRLRDRPECLVR